MDGGKNNSKRKRKGKRKGKEGKEGDGAPGGGENDGSVAKIPRHAAVRPPTTSKSVQVVQTETDVHPRVVQAEAAGF